MRNSNRGPAFLILFATLMAAAGDGVSIVAFPWLVLQREGSAGRGRWLDLRTQRADQRVPGVSPAGQLA